MSTLLGFAQVVLCTADDHLVTMLHEVLDTVTQREHLGSQFITFATRDEGYAVDTEGGLQLSHLEQFVEHHAGIGIALHINHDAHTVLVRLVVNIADTVNLLLAHEASDILDKLGLVNAIWNLGYDDLVVVRVGLNLGLGTHHNASTARLIGVAHATHTIYITAGGEVRSLYILHQVLRGKLGIVDISYTCIDYLAKVMSRHIGSHTYRNTCGTIHEEVGDTCREHTRLLVLTIIVFLEVHRILIYILHHVLTNLAKAGLGITHSSGTVTVNGAKVTLTVYKRVAHSPVLSHTNE